MKNIKKLFGILLAFVFTFASVSAATEKGSITINKAVVGETYTIYRVLDLETYDKANDNYIYRANASFKDFVNGTIGSKYLTAKSENGETYYVWNGEKTDARVKEFTSEAIKYAKDNNNNVSPISSKTATSTTVEFKDLDLGYYLVDTTLGTLLNLTTTNKDVTVYEKNTITPDIDKDVKENSTGTYGKQNDASIGDTVEFKTTITVGAGYENYVLYDKMSKGLTLNSNSIKVYVNNTLVPNDNNINYTIDTTSTTDYTFKVTFANSYITSLPKATAIEVRYTAVLNEGAEIEGTGNINEAQLKYGDNNETDKKKTTTYTYMFDIVKKDGTDETKEKLNGAKFKLYDRTGNNEIKVVFKDETNNIYRLAVEGETGILITAGKATIIGLDAGDYYLEEVEAPTGYNKLTEKVKITIIGINQDKTFNRVNQEIINYTGSQLPETGGIGTTLFLSIGSVLVLAFGLLLVTKLRAYKENI